MTPSSSAPFAPPIGPIWEASACLAAPKSSTVQILLVEDDPVPRRALLGLVGKMGYSAVAAGTLSEAMDRLRLRPQVIVLDLLLPDGDGVEVLRRVRQSGAPSRVGILSAVNDPPILSKVWQWQPDAMFGKPVDLEDFRDWLHRELG